MESRLDPKVKNNQTDRGRHVRRPRRRWEVSLSDKLTKAYLEEIMMIKTYIVGFDVFKAVTTKSTVFEIAKTSPLKMEGWCHH
jgi:hypothetical protein